MLLDDSHFAGINKFKEAVKDEVIKKKAKQEMVSIYKLLKERNIKLSLGVYPWPAQLKEIIGRNC